MFGFDFQFLNYSKSRRISENSNLAMYLLPGMLDSYVLNRGCLSNKKPDLSQCPSLTTSSKKRDRRKNETPLNNATCAEG